MELNRKYEMLKDRLREYGRVLIAYSGGVDSTFLLKAALDILGKDNVLAVTARSSTYPERELEFAENTAKILGATHLVIESEELDIEEFVKNPLNRCYFCKKELFTKLKAIAEEKGIFYILDGSNYDDLSDFRPGMKALSELDVRSPLMECGLTKDDIRSLSKTMGLPTWNKPSFACLSSRFPYGHRIDRDKLKMIDRAEQHLLDHGFREVRVRVYDKMVRIEVNPHEIKRFLEDDLRENVVKKFKEIGFTHISLDLEGYRTGSMNEGLGSEVNG